MLSNLETPIPIEKTLSPVYLRKPIKIGHSLKHSRWTSDLSQRSIPEDTSIEFVTLNLRRSKSLPDKFPRKVTKLYGETDDEVDGKPKFKRNTDSYQADEILHKNRHRRVVRAASHAQVQYALIRAAIFERDKIQLMRLLQRKDVDVNNIDVDGLAPIHFAAMKGSVDTVKILIKHGAEIDILSHQNEYPLDIAVREGNFEIAQYLINKGAGVKNIVNGMKYQRKRANTIVGPFL